MGKEIEQIAINRGHSIVLTIDVNNQEDFTAENLRKADVAIEFTSPGIAVNNFLQCFNAGIPVVSGTTGWLEQREFVENVCKEKNGCFFYTSNFSLGANLFFELNRHLAHMMKGFPQYDVSITEIHHLQKLDAPSGTAISLAADIISEHGAKVKWTIEEPKSQDELHIQPIREGTVPGIHTVKYNSEVDFIEITHSAYSRKGLALGAVMAAEFSAGRKGIYTMTDLLKF
jgi:4-hydroxy-tetrahydrodipicolinate reductase